MKNESIINEIVSRVKKNFRIESIIIFGSAAAENSTEDSDIDILIILDENGIASKFMELVQRRNRVSSLLMDIKKKVALDILVYTREEWQELVKDGSSFTREIIENGRRVA